jgi:hypothetical protein
MREVFKQYNISSPTYSYCRPLISTVFPCVLDVLIDFRVGDASSQYILFPLITFIFFLILKYTKKDLRKQAFCYLFLLLGCKAYRLSQMQNQGQGPSLLQRQGQNLSLELLATFSLPQE